MLNLAVRNTSKLIREKSKTENVRLGRLFTKKNTARLMADMIKLDPEKTAYTILDPGAGTGILAAAAVEHICKNAPKCKQIFLTCYENDPDFLPMLEDNLERIRKKCRHDYDVRLFVTVYDENYLVDVKNHYTVTFFDTVEDKFDVIICNPPTELIEKGSPDAEAVGCVTMLKVSAAYLFFKVASEHLEANGSLVIMLPTPVASASSITAIRRDIATRLALRKIHLFIGKQKNLKRAIPLKKSIILAYENNEEKSDILISTSTDDGSLEKTASLPALPCTVIRRYPAKFTPMSTVYVAPSMEAIRIGRISSVSRIGGMICAVNTPVISFFWGTIQPSDSNSSPASCFFSSAARGALYISPSNRFCIWISLRVTRQFSSVGTKVSTLPSS